MSGSLPHIQNQSRLSYQILPRKSYMRHSPVSVSALLCKRNAVCVLCHLKYFYILPVGLFFGILRSRNIGISEHWAVPVLMCVRFSLVSSPLNNVTYKHIGPAETNKQTTQEATGISGPMNRRDSCSINCCCYW